jgi:pyruvate kinase
MAEPSGAPVDVVAIMKEIRESIQKKRAQGVYTDEEVESLAALRLRAFAEEAKIDDKLLERLLGPSHDWNVSADYLIRTTRTGLGARALILAKKIVRPFIRLYTDHVLNRQAQLNLYFAHLLHNSIREGARLQLEMQGLRHRVQELERELVLRRGDPVDRRRTSRDEPEPR